MTDINALTIEYQEEGVVIVKELAKEVLSKGAWTTIVFKFSNIDKATGEYSAPQFSVRRYQKRGDEYIQKSKMNISSVSQAKKLIEVLDKWIKEDPENNVK